MGYGDSHLPAVRPVMPGDAERQKVQKSKSPRTQALPDSSTLEPSKDLDFPLVQTEHLAGTEKPADSGDRKALEWTGKKSCSQIGM